MATFAEIVDKVDALTKDEVEELKKIVELKWIEIRRKEILEAAREGRKEHLEGKTVVLSTPDEIKSYFLKLVTDED